MKLSKILEMMSDGVAMTDAGTGTNPNNRGLHNPDEEEQKEMDALMNRETTLEAIIEAFIGTLGPGTIKRTTLSDQTREEDARRHLNAAASSVKKWKVNRSGSAAPEEYSSQAAAVERYNQLGKSDRNLSSVVGPDGKVIIKQLVASIQENPTNLLYESIIDSFVHNTMIIPIPVNGLPRSPNFKKHAMLTACTGG